MRRYVGNGVVNLGHPENRKLSADQDVLEKFFTRAEKEVIFSSADYAENAWILWSCKTTAFKIASKLSESLEFEPQNMQVIPFGGEYEPAHHTIYARVSTGMGPVFTETRISGEQLCTFGTNEMQALKAVEHHAILLPNEKGQSEQTRIHALAHIAESLEIPASELSIAKDSFGIPRVLRAGENSPIDVSLSHNYGLIAFAYLSEQ